MKKKFLVITAAVAVTVALLVGATFAWFTDFAGAGLGAVQAGTVQIEVTGGAFTAGTKWYPGDNKDTSVTITNESPIDVYVLVNLDASAVGTAKVLNDTYNKDTKTGNNFFDEVPWGAGDNLIYNSEVPFTDANYVALNAVTDPESLKYKGTIEMFSIAPKTNATGGLTQIGTSNWYWVILSAKNAGNTDESALTAVVSLDKTASNLYQNSIFDWSGVQAYATQYGDTTRDKEAVAKLYTDLGLTVPTDFQP